MQPPYLVSLEIFRIPIFCDNQPLFIDETNEESALFYPHFFPDNC